jgi:putative alpha-1,2-mannosidase
MFIAVKSRRSISVIAVSIAVSFALNLCGSLKALAQEPIDSVNPMIGTTGPTENDYGGMIPGVATPFGMTHWTVMTRENKISVCPYNYKDTTIQGFLGTHQPAIWMGDYGQVRFPRLTTTPSRWMTRANRSRRN